MPATTREETLRHSFGGRLLPRPLARSESAKGADARHQENRNTPLLFRWPLDTAAVLRVFLGSAAGQPCHRPQAFACRAALRATLFA